MKVILLQELKGKGGEGDVIDVAPGFANNYLFRQNIAIPATKGNLKQLEQRRHNIAKREETRIAVANATKEALDGTVVKVAAQVGEEGQLFGSVTAPIIADAIKEATGVEVDKRRIELKQPIKTAGEHEVPISLYRTIKATPKILVGRAEELFPAAPEPEPEPAAAPAEEAPAPAEAAPVEEASAAAEEAVAE